MPITLAMKWPGKRLSLAWTGWWFRLTVHQEAYSAYRIGGAFKVIEGTRNIIKWKALKSKTPHDSFRFVVRHNKAR